MQVIDDDAGLLDAHGAALFCRGATDLVFDGIEHGDAAQHLCRDRRVLGQFVEFAPNVRPAERQAELLATLGQRVITAVAIDLQETAIVPQMRLGALTLAIGRADVGHQWWIIAAPWPVVAGTGPKLSCLRSSAPRLKYGGGGLIRKQTLGSSQLFENVISQGSQILCRPANPVSQWCKNASMIDWSRSISAKAPNCAEVSRITPSWFAGHLKPPDSIFLAIRHSPVPSHQTSLTRSDRLAQNR